MSAGSMIDRESIDAAAGLPEANPEQAALTADWGGARRVRATAGGARGYLAGRTVTRRG